MREAEGTHRTTTPWEWVQCAMEAGGTMAATTLADVLAVATREPGGK